MKKTFFFIAFSVLVFNCQAQVDVKINPIGLLFSNANLAAEFGTNRFGVEPSIGLSYDNPLLPDNNFSSIGHSYGFKGKYYFKPQKDFVGLYTGMYLRGEQTDFTSKNSYVVATYSREFWAIGYVLGYKWVTKRNIVFDFDAGLGRKLMYKKTEPITNFNGASIYETQSFESPVLDGYFRFAVGYRFGGNKSEKNR